MMFHGMCTIPLDADEVAYRWRYIAPAYEEPSSYYILKHLRPLHI